MQILFCLKSDDFELQPGIPLPKSFPVSNKPSQYRTFFNNTFLYILLIFNDLCIGT